MSLDEAFEAQIAAAVERVLAPYLGRLSDPEPLVYSLRDCAKVLSTSVDTVRRLIAEDVLPIVPHMGERKLIPRAAVLALVESDWRKLRAAS